MRWITGILLSILTVLLSCNPRPEFFIRYKSTFDEITIENKRLTLINFKHHYPQDRPFVATPDSISATIVLDRVLVPKRRLEELHQMLNEGFMDLPETLGAPAGERAYPSEILVRRGKNEKKVVFRSHPAFENEPVPYAMVKNFLILIAQEQKNLLFP